MPKSPTSFRSEVLVQPERMAIYAAAKNYTIGKARKGVPVTSEKQAGEEWEETGWDFYDTIGEYRYAVDWVGNLLSRATLHVTQDGKRSDNELANEVIGSLFGGPDGQSEMLRSLGIHYTVAGEAYVIGADVDDQDDWYVIAATEVKRSGDNRFSVKGLDLEIEEGSSLVMRLWRAHPRKPWKSNAPTRAVLPILAEIEKLTMHVAAQLDSRLAGAGLLLLPSQMTFPQMPNTQVAPIEDDENETASTPNGAQAFVNMLIEVMSKAIGDRSDASALVPVVLQVAGEYLEKVQHLKFWSELDEKAIELRKEAISRLALGMDMPPEILTGTAEVNHWGAWQVDESSIKSHSEPLLKAITSALTVGYLRPVLEAEGMDPDEAATFSIGADTTQLRMRPNRSREAQEIWEKGELKGATMRTENGFTEDDAPDDVERRMWMLRQIINGHSSASPARLEQALQLLGLEIRTVESMTPEESRDPMPQPSLEDHPDRNPPEEVVAAAEVMVFRALERAGNRLKVRLAGKTNGTPAHELYLKMPQLTPAEVDALLEDAWTSTEWAKLPCAADDLEQVLNRYTHMLLALRKPHDRALLALNLHEIFVDDRAFTVV